MKIKNGFTLAEILIVLMVIGVIAALTLPALLRGVMEAQIKAGYKKAFHVVENVIEKEYLGGTLPAKRNAESATKLFAAFANTFHLREIILSNGLDDGIVPVSNNDTIKQGIDITSGSTTVHIGVNSETSQGIAPGVNQVSSWVISEDSIGYAMLLSGDDDAYCPSKAVIASAASSDDAVTAACSIIVVDVNGMWRGPNKLERQLNSSNASDAKADSVKDKNTGLNTLTKDRYYIYIGSDGATVGPVDVTISGRILNNLK